MDLVPPTLIVARYLADAQAEVDDLTAAEEEATRAVDEYVEEHAVEDGLLAEAMDDEKISKALVSARLKEAKKEDSDPDEVKALAHLLKLYDAEATAKKAGKEAQAALDLATLKKYGNLTEEEVKTLVLDDKWQATVTSRITFEVESLTLALVDRILELGERYAEAVGALDAALEEVESKVSSYLAATGMDT